MNGIMGLQVLLNTLVMLAWSAVFFIVGVWRFHKKIFLSMSPGLYCNSP
jgi:hypothetical protein